jgi:hypothetical protein
MARAHAGETWGYRIGRKVGVPLTPVEVTDLPEKRRAVIRHLEGPQAGEEENVPLQRLVVPWDEAAGFMDDERRLQEVYDTPWGDYGDLELEAVLTVAYGAFDYPFYVISPGYGQEPAGIISTPDPERLASTAGMTVDELLAMPNAFIDRTGRYTAPFVAAVEITKHYCQHDPRNILEGTRLLEEQLETVATTAYLPFGMPVSHDYAVDNLRRVRPALDLLRSWCGAEAMEEWDELASLRAEVDRLQELIEEIAYQIDQAGHSQLARRLREVMINREQKSPANIMPSKKQRKATRNR